LNSIFDEIEGVWIEYQKKSDKPRILRDDQN